jgi:hypothetical protein
VRGDDLCTLQVRAGPRPAHPGDRALGRGRFYDGSLREGIRTGLLSGIELALDLKFGAAGLAILPELSAIEDVSDLRAVHAAILTATTPEDVRAAY